LASGDLTSFYSPALPGWRWEPVTQTRLRIPARARKTLWDRSGCGWLYYVFMVLDNPDVLLCLDLYADGRVEIRVSPRMLYEWGAIGSNPGVITLYKYDETSNVYAIGYAPQGALGVPFRGRIRAWLENNTPRESRVDVLEAWIIMLKGAVVEVVERCQGSS